MKRAIVALFAVMLAICAAFFLLPVRKDGKIDAPDAFADSPKQSATVSGENASAPLHDIASSPASPAPSQEEGFPKSIPEMRAKIREFADTKHFPYSVLSAILNGPFPQDIKFMALQAFAQVHWSKSDEIYRNTPDLLNFIEKNLYDMSENENYRGVTMMLVDQLNDDSNPNQEAALRFFEEKFHEYRNTNKEMAKLFLRGFKDQDMVKEIMNDKSNKVLSEAAQNLLPQIASPRVIKEIIQDNRFTPDQQAVALQRVASNVDGEKRANGMTDTEALIILAKDLDRKKGTKDKFYKAVLYGISGSKLKDREKFLVDGMKKSLEPYKAKTGRIAYSSIPELSVMFGYLVELPENSSAYDYFISELNRMAAEPKCPQTQADYAVIDLITFWQDACERSVDDCPEKAKKNDYYKTISDKYMSLKGRCPEI